jgi:hypothetical protein
VATGGALRGAGERAGERARGVPGAGEDAAFVGPPASAARLPRGPARAHAVQRRRCTRRTEQEEHQAPEAENLAAAERKVSQICGLCEGVGAYRSQRPSGVAWRGGGQSHLRRFVRRKGGRLRRPRLRRGANWAGAARGLPGREEAGRGRDGEEEGKGITRDGGHTKAARPW